MITEFTFRFEELTIDLEQVKKVLGYDGAFFPEPFNSYLLQALNVCSQLPDIRGAYYISDHIETVGSNRSVFAEGVEFKVGKTLWSELAGSEKLAFFVCTAGKTISKKSTALLKGDDPVLGYVYDVVGSEIVEAVANQLQQLIRSDEESIGMKITNRYSPGYCHWSVADQHKLFSLLGGNPCGVSLTDSSLMYPVKSISGVIGIGKEVAFHDYQCSLCNMENCVYRVGM